MPGPSSSPKQVKPLTLGFEDRKRIELTRVKDNALRMIECAERLSGARGARMSEADLSWLKQHGLQITAAAERLEKLMKGEES